MYNPVSLCKLCGNILFKTIYHQFKGQKLNFIEYLKRYNFPDYIEKIIIERYKLASICRLIF